MGTTHTIQPEPNDNELYGPWMIVDTWRRRNSSFRINGGGLARDSRNKVEVGSRFASLVTEDVVDVREGISTGTSPQPLRPLSLFELDVIVIAQDNVGKSDRCIAKPSEVKSRHQPVLSDWMLNFSRQLDAPQSNTGQAEVGAIQGTSALVDSSSPTLGSKAEHASLTEHGVSGDPMNSQKSMEQ
ncbi:hypothetical protein V6N12_009909 [Hibiscus sabdariffa]|uniref:Uncharacterized protein n=1 Tax=Hibiscus sabdariffa TaxID=183260 RepID=A0ABR2EDW2_9ROSI